MNNTAIFALAAAMGLTMSTATLAESRTYELTGFERVEINTGINAVVTFGEAFAVTAEANNGGIFDKLKLRVDGDTLSATIEQSFLDFIASGGLVGQLLSNGNAVNITITLPRLSGAAASSGAHIAIAAPTGDLALDASSGAGIVVTEATLASLEVSTSSGGHADLAGMCQAIAADASSGSDITASKLKCVDATIESSSGASISVFANNSVNGDASSGGNVQVYGPAPKVAVEQSSGGHLTMMD